MRTFEELFARFQKQKTSETSDARTRRKRFVKPTSPPLDVHPPHSSLARAQVTNVTLSENETINLAQEVFPGAGVLHYHVVPSECVHRDCAAAGYWEGHGNEAWCFYEAVFLGRATKPQLARERRKGCPLSHQGLAATK